MTHAIQTPDLVSRPVRIDTLETENRLLLTDKANLEFINADLRRQLKAVYAQLDAKQSDLFAVKAMLQDRAAKNLRDRDREITRLRGRLANVGHHHPDHYPTCESCEGEGADLNHCRKVIRGGDLMDAETLVATFCDDTGDFAPDCPEEDCFEGRIVGEL